MRRDFGAGRAFLAAALLVLGAAAPAISAEPASGQLAGAGGLRPLLRALAALEHGRARQPVRIIQLGDSHTANDSFSGHLRERLQARFGAAGRGWLPAGIPYKYFRPQLVEVAEAGWKHLRPADADAVPLGLDASAAEAAMPDARMALASGEPEGFDRFSIEYVGRPRAAPLILRVDQGTPVRIRTSAPKVAARRAELRLPQPAHRVELGVAAGPPTQLLGWAVERRGPGIIYENHGTIGAMIGLLGKLDPATVEFELGERRPALLIVAFGTNEGFDDSLDLTAYAARFQAAVAGLRQAARGAGVLIIGPPDGDRLPKECAAAAANASCGSTADGDTCIWNAPRNLAAVRDIQRRIAARQGWAFWDWSAAMGGACSTHRLATQDPPLAMPDHVHLTKAGYAMAADRLFADLMQAYEGWQRAERR